MDELSDLRSDDPVIQAAAWFADVSEHLHSELEQTVTLERICEQAMEVVAASQHCSITLRRRRGVLETVASSDELVTQCDALQYELHEGPCLDSALDQGAFLVRDTATDTRWPVWGPRAAELGMRSLISVQLVSPHQPEGNATMGAINIYGSRIASFTNEDLDRSLIFASHAGNALAAAQLVSGLETAVHSRHLIGVAQGILMQRYDLSMERSFDAMRRYSSEANMKLRDVAQLIVDGRRMPMS